jgi:hypothetical protein
VAASGPPARSLTSFCHVLAPGDRLHLAHLPGLTCVTFCDQFCACRLTIQSRRSVRFEASAFFPSWNAEMDVLGWSAGKADWQELIWSTGIMILLAPRD